MSFHFRRSRTDRRSKAEVLKILLKAAAHFGDREFTRQEFNVANLGISASGVRYAFGRWSRGMDALREELHRQGKVLAPLRREIVWSDEDMFREMHRIWSELGHRPSKDEWESGRPTISYNTYRRRFRGWENACLRFIEYQQTAPPTGTSAGPAEAALPEIDRIVDEDYAKTAIRKRPLTAERRDPPQKLVNKVWKRDKFRCCLCGRCPATHDCVLEVDHIVPWARGGRTVLENLQTLCANCNRSKRDDLPRDDAG